MVGDNLDWRRKLELINVDPRLVNPEDLTWEKIMYYTKHNISMSVDAICIIRSNKLDRKWKERQEPKEEIKELIVEPRRKVDSLTLRRLKILNKKD